MPVRKTAAKKTAPAKKTAAKKSSGNDENEVAPSAAEKSTAKKIVEAIKGGHFDPYLSEIDSALSDRINRHIQEQAAAKRVPAAPAAPEKKVSAPPKKTKLVEPEEGAEYKVAARVRNLGGAKVRFIRFKPDTDKAKSVVELVTGVPGSPKGKRVVMPTAALEEISGNGKKKPVRKKK